MPHKTKHEPIYPGARPTAREVADAIHEADRRILDRMLFFSDAVFAIVLTLLVLDLRPPEGFTRETIGVGAILGAMTLHFVSFINSFLLVGMWWFVHMRITKPILAFDWPVAILNFFFLLTVTLAPFASALLSRYGRTGAAWEIYWGVNAMTSVTLAALSLASTRGRGRLVGGMTGKVRAVVVARILSPGVCFAAGIWFGANGNVALAGYAWVPIPVLIMIMSALQKRISAK